MNHRRQMLLSAGLVLAAAGTVAAFSLGGESPQQQGAGGHDHSAMAAAASGGNPVKLTDEAARRIGVSYATVVRRPLARSLELVGNVTYDETRLRNVNPKIEGWAERLFVDFTGAEVRQGQPLLAVYSPMLVSAQEELLLARKLVESAGGSERAARNAQDLLEGARRRLRYWDIPESEIARIERSGEPVRTVMLRAPASGVVVEKLVIEGMRIMPGMDLYRIADLSRVWVEGEVYEKDLAQVRLGQSARVSLEAYPGQTFVGRVTYIYPTLSIESRTARLRVELANPDGRLKPGMYARLALDATSTDAVLVVPRTAVHFTGQRAIVFVRHADGTLMPHDVVTGSASGNDIVVLSGISEGQQVVRSASFLVDAESNLGVAAGPSMTDDGAAVDHSQHGAAAAPAAAPVDHSSHGAPAKPAAPAGKPAADPHAAHRKQE